MMTLRQRYRRLTLWNKIAFWGSVASLAGLLIAISAFFFGGGGSDRSVKAKGDIKIENGIIQTGDGTIDTSKPGAKR